ncbi:MAG: replication factor C large subunit [Candidatus Woesearchaeota archaeon]|jgi:replication factor C large subunit
MTHKKEDSALWSEKYLPKKISEYIGREKEVEEVLSFIKNYKKQRKKAILLYGPCGSGKTSLIHAISKELGLELIEVNASDDRNKEQLELKVGNAINQQSLFGTSKLILLDEVDGLSGTYDRGATSQISSLIKLSKYPIVMTGNNIWDKKFSELRTISQMIEFPEYPHATILKILEHICKSEKIHYDVEILKSFARRAGGDVRGAINDLQSICSHDKKLSKDNFETVSDRRHVESVPQALTKIFKTTDCNIAIKAFDDADIDMDEQFLWLEENIPIEYEKPLDIYRAFDALSRADVFRGRIIRQQHWHFLTTINALLTCGVAVAKDEKYKKFVEYKRNERILKMWILNNTNAKKKSICEKIANKTVESKKSIYKNGIRYYKLISKNDPSFAKEFAREFELEDEEVEWLVK